MAVNEITDMDLISALQENPQDGFAIEDITQILAVIEGERDGPNWIWIVALSNGKFVYLEGGCDYTGWDCQSGLSSTILNDPTEGVALVERHKKDIELAIQTSLVLQLSRGKNETWRERTDKELGLI